MHTVESTPGARQLGPSARSRPQEEAPWGNGRPHPASCGGDSGRGPRGRFPAWRRFDVLRAALPAGLLRPRNPFWGQLSLWPPQHARIPGVFISSSSSCSSRRSGSARSGCAPMARQPGFRETPSDPGHPRRGGDRLGLCAPRAAATRTQAGRGGARSVGLRGLVWGVLRGPIRAGPPPPRGTTWHSLL